MNVGQDLLPSLLHTAKCFKIKGLDNVQTPPGLLDLNVSIHTDSKDILLGLHTDSKDILLGLNTNSNAYFTLRAPSRVKVSAVNRCSPRSGGRRP